MKKQVLVICQHGDEKAPFKVFNKYFKDRFDAILGNPKAFKKNVRFLESDLNRSFPGSKSGLLEEKIAFKLLKKLKMYQQVVDFHTATCDTPIFIILTKTTKKHLKLARSTGIKKIVYMQESIASGKALIDHVPVGISIEAGDEKLPVTKKRIKKVLNNLISGKDSKSKLQCYSVFGVIKKELGHEQLAPNIKHFKKVKKGDTLTNIRKSEFDFYPVLARETNYKDILCLMAKKVRERDIIRE